MTNEQILERQVEALEKLLQLKEAVIDELENKVQKLQGQQVHIGSGSGYQPYIPSVWTNPTPSWQCVDGTPHQYPQNWLSITPPCCTRCGQMPQQAYPGLGGAGTGWTITSGGAGAGQNVGVAGQPITHTTGYIQPVKTLAVDGIAETVGHVFTLANTGNK